MRLTRLVRLGAPLGPAAYHSPEDRWLPGRPSISRDLFARSESWSNGWCGSDALLVFLGDGHSLSPRAFQ